MTMKAKLFLLVCLPFLFGFGPFVAVVRDSEGDEVSRRLLIPDLASADVVDGAGVASGTWQYRPELALYEVAVSGGGIVGSVSSIPWTGEGSTGALPFSGGTVELMEPGYAMQQASDYRTMQATGLILGVLLWVVIRDSVWRRSMDI